MFNSIKINDSWRNGTSVAGIFFVAVVLLLIPISANAQCTDWTAAGQWNLMQGTRGFGFDSVNLKLTQNGSKISGTASRKAMGVQGPVSGTLSGDNFSITITWSDGRPAVYTSKIQTTGKLQGELYYPNSGKVNDPWYSEGVLGCRTLISGGGIGTVGGGGRQSGGAPVKPGPAASSIQKIPFMAASQAYFQPSFSQTGFAVLTWDGGPDHPNAEVWVKYGNSRDRVLFLKQPKGGQQVTVQRGLMYTYALIDGRTVLGTAVVFGQ